MSKKVKKNNTTEEVTTNKVTETKVETTSAAPTEAEPVIAPKKVEKSEAKAVKETKEVKAAPKKAAEKKATAKVAVKEIKEVKEAKAPVEQIFVQYAGNEYATELLVASAKEAWTNAGHKASSIKSLNLYVKPEENAAYYVINEKETGKIDL